jgi:hypothetical protein
VPAELYGFDMKPFEVNRNSASLCYFLTISTTAFIGFTKLGGGPGVHLAFGAMVGLLCILIARRTSR